MKEIRFNFYIPLLIWIFSGLPIWILFVEEAHDLEFLISKGIHFGRYYEFGSAFLHSLISESFQISPVLSAKILLQTSLALFLIAIEKFRVLLNYDLKFYLFFFCISAEIFSQFYAPNTSGISFGFLSIAVYRLLSTNKLNFLDFFLTIIALSLRVDSAIILLSASIFSDFKNFNSLKTKFKLDRNLFIFMKKSKTLIMLTACFFVGITALYLISNELVRGISEFQYSVLLIRNIKSMLFAFNPIVCCLFFLIFFSKKVEVYIFSALYALLNLAVYRGLILEPRYLLSFIFIIILFYQDIFKYINRNNFIKTCALFFLVFSSIFGVVNFRNEGPKNIGGTLFKPLFYLHYKKQVQKSHKKLSRKLQKIFKADSRFISLGSCNYEMSSLYTFQKLGYKSTDVTNGFRCPNREIILSKNNTKPNKKINKLHYSLGYCKDSKYSELDIRRDDLIYLDKRCFEKFKKNREEQYKVLIEPQNTLDGLWKYLYYTKPRINMQRHDEMYLIQVI